MDPRPKFLLKNSSQLLNYQKSRSPLPGPSIFSALTFIRRSQRNIDLSPGSLRTPRYSNNSKNQAKRKRPSAERCQANLSPSLESSPSVAQREKFEKLMTSIETLQQQNKQFKYAASKGPENFKKFYKRPSFIKNKKSLKEFRKRVVKIKKQL